MPTSSSHTHLLRLSGLYPKTRFNPGVQFTPNPMIHGAQKRDPLSNAFSTNQGFEPQTLHRPGKLPQQVRAEPMSALGLGRLILRVVL